MKRIVTRALQRFERGLAKTFFKRSNGVVYINEHCMGDTSTSEENIAGSRVLSILDHNQVKHSLVNGKPCTKWQKLAVGDVVDVHVRPCGFVGDIVGAAVGFVLVTLNPVTSALYAVGVGLLVGTGISVLTRLLTPTPDAPGATDESRQRSSIRGAENTESKGVLPILFGRQLQTPFYGQKPYRLVNDGSPSNKYLQYFVGNYSNVNIEAEKLGESDIGSFSTEYLTINKSFGGSSYIGFDNVLSAPKEETLSVDNSEAVSQVSAFSYNQADTSTTLEYEGILEFTDASIPNWGDKTFKVTVTVDTASGNIDLTHEFVVTSGDLTLVGGSTYRTTVNHTFSDPITEIVSTRFEPVSDTRITVWENDNELESVIISEEITTDGFNTTTSLNNGINKYLGVVTETIETSPKNTKEIDFIFSFPQGLFTQNDNGSRTRRSTTVSIQYKEVGGVYQDIANANAIYVRDIDGVKQPLSNYTTTVTDDVVYMEAPTDVKQADELFYKTIGIELDAGQYTLRVRSADLLEKTSKDVGSVTMSEFNFFVDGDAVDHNVLPKVNQIAVQAIAYKSLSGELKKYNYIGKLECPVWNGTDWDTVAETRNPAAIVRFLLTDNLVNPRAEPVSYLDNDTLTELYDFCEANNYYADGLVTEPTKIGAVVARILDNCKAGFTLVEGKYLFVIDDDSKVPYDMFTPHNTWDFQWTPNAGRAVDALRIKYIDEETFDPKELTLYYYDGDVHETIKAGTADDDYEILVEESQYIINRDHIIDRFSYSLRNIQEKRNAFEFKVNLEGLNRRLFDRVYIANSCDMETESSGLIKSLITSGGNITGFKLYSKIDIVDGSSITIRSIDTDNQNSVVNIYAVTNSGTTDTVLIDPIPNNGIIKGRGSINGFTDGYTWDYDGDNFDVGVSEIYTALITNIRYNDDLTATIEAREV